MKKNRILLSLAIASLLASCGRQTSSSLASSDPLPSSEAPTSIVSEEPSLAPTSSEEEEEEGEWPEGVKNELDDTFFGLDLPFIELGEEGYGNASYDLYDRCTMTLIGGNDLTAVDLASYAAKFIRANFEEDDSVDEGGDYPCYFFKKTLETEDGDRHVKVAIRIVDEDGEPANAGLIEIEISTPYIYAWPSEFLAYSLYYGYGSEATVPSFSSADYYDIDEANGIVYAYTSSIVLATFSYAGSLVEAGYVHQEEKFGLDDLFVSPDGTFSIAFHADTEIGALVIRLAGLPAYPEEAIKAFYEAYEGPELNLPSFDIDGVTYRFVIDSNNAMYANFGMGDMVNATLIVNGISLEQCNAYFASLANLATSYSGETTLTYLFEVGEATYRVEATYKEDASELRLVYYPCPMNPRYTSWPAEQILSLFSSLVYETVPEFEGEADYFEIRSLGNGAYSMGDFLMIACEDYLAALASYEATLESERFTKVAESETGVVTYYSQSHRIVLSLQPAEGGLTIQIRESVLSLSEVLEGRIPSANLFDLPTGSYCNVFSLIDGTLMGAPYDFATISSSFPSEEAAKNALPGYLEGIVAAGYVELANEPEGSEEEESQSETHIYYRDGLPLQVTCQGNAIMTTMGIPQAL